MDNVLNAITNTAAASAGYAENWRDFGANLLANGIANGVGLQGEKLPIWRAVGATGKKIIKQSINSFADKGKEMFYDNKSD